MKAVTELQGWCMHRLLREEGVRGVPWAYDNDWVGECISTSSFIGICIALCSCAFEGEWLTLSGCGSEGSAVPLFFPSHHPPPPVHRTTLST